MKDGEIIPGKKIGDIELNISKQELLNLIGELYCEKQNDIGSIIESENTKFWIGGDGKLKQIGVGKGFIGKLQGKIGIGSTLQDVQTYMGEYDDSDELFCTYKIKGIEGFCFELKDVESYEEEWDEMTAPIEHMYVYTE